VAIHQLHELSHIAERDGGLRIGSLATHGAIVAHPPIATSYSALADASSIVGSHATRATGTIGGNVMTASPAMDTGGPLLCLGASLVLQSSRSQRTLSLNDFFVGPGRTIAEADELLVAIDLPAPSIDSGSCYVRLEYRRQMEIAVVGATAYVQLDGDHIVDARIAITALAPTIHRVVDAEDALTGTNGARLALDSAAALAADAASPISDVRASSDYRRAMTKVMVRRAIGGALRRARGEVVAIPATAELAGVR
jgi:CO/xanthine dehydrogenase FAD-binding subunit